MIKKIEKKINKNWIFRNSSETSWYKAQVPGCVHTDLLYNDLIQDPFYGTNEAKLQWISEKNWEYKTTLKIDEDFYGKKVQLLKFYGLDTYAKVFVNGKELIETDNMFCSWEVSVKNIFKIGKNEIVICFESPIKKIIPKMSKMDYELPADNDKIKKTSPYTRKAPYHYGWDWGPSFATCGIWQNVKIIAYDLSIIQDVHINQKKVRPESAEIEIIVTIESNTISDADLVIIEPKSKINILKTVKINKGKNRLSRALKITAPELWWPNGHGPQNMYEFEVQIKIGNYKDVKIVRTGLRDFKIKLDKDDSGSSFTFTVNNKPIFSKGFSLSSARTVSKYLCTIAVSSWIALSTD